MEWLNKKYPLYLFLMLFVFSCQKETTPRSFVNWVEHPDHGLKIIKEVGSLRYQLQYKPPEYIIAMEERKEQIAAEELQEKMEQLGDELDYYNFQIAPTNGIDLLQQLADSEEKYHELFEYFTYQLKKDLYVLNGRDTSRCELFQFIPNQQMTPNLDFVLAFEKPKNSDRLFVYDDAVFRNGAIRMTVQQQAINQLPKMKTN